MIDVFVGLGCGGGVGADGGVVPKDTPGGSGFAGVPGAGVAPDGAAPPGVVVGVGAGQGGGGGTGKPPGRRRVFASVPM